jgi:hypothetical protein
MAALTPTKPLIKTGGRDTSLYIINKHPNRVYAIKPKSDDLKICIVSFTNISHAYLMAGMMEEHKHRTREWPPLLQEDGYNSFMLPTSQTRESEMLELSVEKWNKDKLGVFCAKNMLDLLILTRITPTKSGYNIGGDSYAFNASLEFYQSRFEELFDM